jgi:hypothetical protein
MRFNEEDSRYLVRGNSRPFHTKFHGPLLSWWKFESTDGAASRINKDRPLIASQFPFWSEITGTEVKIETWSASNDFGLEADRATPRNLVILGTLFLEF